MEPRTKITEREFRLLKGYLYQAQYALKRCIEVCPELQEICIPLKDGHQLLPAEMALWLESVRSECWKYGPKKLQKRKLEEIVDGQPKG
ncbi:MAG TPA: hypothetical protein VNV43_00260 [Candidatus Acidoferrales bacterium]|jgi:hypothetical protein|nr:hypothetical protein [Candidatus Acidoferrales bacterium]